MTRWELALPAIFAAQFVWILSHLMSKLYHVKSGHEVGSDHCTILCIWWTLLRLLTEEKNKCTATRGKNSVFWLLMGRYEAFLASTCVILKEFLLPGEGMAVKDTFTDHCTSGGGWRTKLFIAWWNVEGSIGGAAEDDWGMVFKCKWSQKAIGFERVTLWHTSSNNLQSNARKQHVAD